MKRDQPLGVKVLILFSILGAFLSILSITSEFSQSTILGVFNLFRIVLHGGTVYGLYHLKSWGGKFAIVTYVSLFLGSVIIYMQDPNVGLRNVLSSLFLVGLVVYYVSTISDIFTN